MEATADKLFVLIFLTFHPVLCNAFCLAPKIIILPGTKRQKLVQDINVFNETVTNYHMYITRDLTIQLYIS